MEEWMKRGLIVIAFFVLISPLGILLTWEYGDAWGEWGEVNQGNATWTPQGYGGGAPLPDYGVPSWESKLMATAGYWLSAIIGIVMCILVTLGFAKAMELLRGEEK